jgi:hypothetical protein
VVNAVVFYLLAGYGIIVLSLSFAAISLLQFIVMQTITGRMIGLKWSTYLRAMALNTAKSIAIGVLAYASCLIGQAAGLGSVALLAAMVIVSIITFMAIAFAFNREYLRELKELIIPAATQG